MCIEQSTHKSLIAINKATNTSYLEFKQLVRCRRSKPSSCVVFLRKDSSVQQTDHEYRPTLASSDHSNDVSDDINLICITILCLSCVLQVKYRESM